MPRMNPGGAAPAQLRLRLTAALAAVCVAAVLVLGKLVAWRMTGSVSLLSSLIDSLLDLGASLMNLLAIRYALKPPDRGHRFGHGKAEPLAALAQVLVIAGSMVFLLVEAVRRLLEPQPVEHPGIGVAVMVFAMVVTLALVRYQRHVVRRTGSFAIRADSLHYVGDLLANGAVIVALVLSAGLGWTLVDPLLGLAIGVYILRSLVPVARGALDMLMDHELPEDERREIARIAESHGKVHSMHGLRTRAAGPQRFIQLHLVLDGALVLAEAHRIGDEVHDALLKAYPGAHVVIHLDPHDDSDSDGWRD